MCVCTVLFVMGGISWFVNGDARCIRSSILRLWEHGGCGYCAVYGQIREGGNTYRVLLI
jgi:hypothetical protein